MALDPLGEEPKGVAWRTAYFAEDLACVAEAAQVPPPGLARGIKFAGLEPATAADIQAYEQSADPPVAVQERVSAEEAFEQDCTTPRQVGRVVRKQPPTRIRHDLSKGGLQVACSDSANLMSATVDEYLGICRGPQPAGELLPDVSKISSCKWQARLAKPAPVSGHSSA